MVILSTTPRPIMWPSGDCHKVEYSACAHMTVFRKWCCGRCSFICLYRLVFLPDDILTTMNRVSNLYQGEVDWELSKNVYLFNSSFNVEWRRICGVSFVPEVKCRSDLVCWWKVLLMFIILDLVDRLLELSSINFATRMINTKGPQTV